jgi:penicillin-binding protein 1C
MKSFIKLTSLIFVCLIVSACLLLFFIPKPSLLSDVSFSRMVYDDHHQLLRVTLSADEKYRVYTPLKNMSPLLIQATLLQEDQYFYHHLGVNPWALIKAVSQTYLSHNRRRGASTITMQLARMLFHLDSKQVSGKLLQMLRALQLELFYSKNQLLEAYLNLAPYGNNIEGVGAASQIYFQKTAKQLDLLEALTLSVIPQNPSQRIPAQKKLQAVRNKLFMRWVLSHPHDKRYLSAIIHLPLQIQAVKELPFYAPHFVNGVLQRAGNQAMLYTTLNLTYQKTIESVAQRYLQQQKSVGVNNAAILMVDTRTMEVKALMGSADFFKTKLSGQINGTAIKRSPGSALKPFIYALALDQGLIHPNTVLKDVPHSFGSYNPENFDNDFLGPIKAKDALVLSRNIPAIYLADELHHPTLYDFLQSAGIQHLKSSDYYGLALVLGGAELSMQELTTLYAMLLNQGELRPLRMLTTDPIEKPLRLLSPEASFLVVDMLKQTPHSDPAYIANSSQGVKVAWKTGTSSGYRDAWSVGMVGPYVIAVWLGNFDNVGNPALVGRSMATPLMFAVINALKSLPGVVYDSPTPRAGLNITQVSVCKASGLLPTRYCHDREMTYFIPGKSPIKTDTIFREVAINSLNGLRACHLDKHTRFDIYEFWPTDLLAVFRRAGIARLSPPAYEHNCRVDQSTSGIEPMITSPQTDLSYVISSHSADKSVIPLTAIVDADVKKLYWFMNETFLGDTNPNQTIWWAAKPGHYVIRVADDHGRADARNVVIKVR